MNRLEVISAAVHQTWYAWGKYGEPWNLTSTEYRSAIYHMVHFWELVDNSSLSFERFCEVSYVAWKNQHHRVGFSSEENILFPKMRAMVQTYLIMSELLPKEGEAP